MDIARVEIIMQIIDNPINFSKWLLFVFGMYNRKLILCFSIFIIRNTKGSDFLILDDRFLAPISQEINKFLNIEF